MDTLPWILSIMYLILRENEHCLYNLLEKKKKMFKLV